MNSISRLLRKQNSVFVESDGILKNVQVSDIQYLEACANYVILRTSENDEYARLRATLSEAQIKLGSERFARCHKGYFVNLGHICEVRANNILLHSDAAVPLGRQYRAELQKEFLEYVEKAIPR